MTGYFRTIREANFAVHLVKSDGEYKPIYTVDGHKVDGDTFRMLMKLMRDK